MMVMMQRNAAVGFLQHPVTTTSIDDVGGIYRQHGIVYIMQISSS